jgi:hypothetical protein
MEAVMKMFVMVPLLMFGAAAYNIDLPKPQPLHTPVAQPQAGLAGLQQDSETKNSGGSGAEFENKISTLDNVSRMHKALSASA